ncbi:MAG: hypothetical protein AABW81_00950 [Nanoarchaeota archaeon]
MDLNKLSKKTNKDTKKEEFEDELEKMLNTDKEESEKWFRLSEKAEKEDGNYTLANLYVSKALYLQNKTIIGLLYINHLDK